MIEQLRTKIDESSLPVIQGDMASATAPETYTLVYLVYNTISNLLAQDVQVACFRNAARHLGADWAGSEFTEASRSHVSVYRLVERPD